MVKLTPEIIVAVFAVAIASSWTWFVFLDGVDASAALPPNFNCDPQSTEMVFASRSLLALRERQDESPPPLLLLVVLGEVFDVSDGARHYGRTAGYFTFIGQDASRAFHSGDWAAPPQADVRDLPLAGVKGVLGWRDFYRRHATYRRVGVVHGLYYGCGGAPTAALADVEALGRRAADADAAEAALRELVAPCDSRHLVAAKTTTLTCVAPRELRQLAWTNALNGASSVRCACVAPGAEPPLPDGAVLGPYPGCGPEALQRCELRAEE